MFMPHTSQIEIKRSEPKLNADSVRNVKKRNSDITLRVILRDLLKRPKNNKRTLEVNEKDVRLGSLQPFIDEWNRFRLKYGAKFDWRPKTKGQLTCMEKILDICEQNNVKLNVILACCFKAYVFKRHALTLQIVLAYGMDYYDKFAEEVFAEMDEEASQYQSYGFE